MTPEQGTRTICPYCGVGCGLAVNADAAGRIARVRGDAGHAGTRGKLCRKAVYLPQAVNADTRNVQPRLRRARRLDLEPADWGSAMDAAAARLRGIVDRFGPDSVAFYLSGQLLTEDYYVANKLAKGFLGTNNLDSNSRLCMSSAVSAYTLAFGVDGPPCSYTDFDLADCMLFIGSNAAECHPVLFQRAIQHRDSARGRVHIMAVDPRQTDTTRAADLHLQLRPGTDVPLLLGLLHVLVEDRLTDQDFIDAHTSGWEAVADLVRAWTPERTARITGVAVGQVQAAARLFGTARRALSCWAMGVNQSVAGVDTSLALINLHLATGQIGKPGAGPFSLTGQPNAMGGREVGGLAGLLPGHRSVTNAEHRADMARLWRIPVERLRAEPGMTGVEMFQGLADGRLKAIWIAASNPAVSMPDLGTVRAGLQRAELVVVQDAYFPTETARDFADVVLPAAQWAERDGTATSSERRVSYLPALAQAPGSGRPDWAIFADLARRLGFAGDFDYPCAESVFDEYRECTRNTSMDLTGLSYARLQREGGIQWPCPEGAPGGTERLYADGRGFGTANGRAHFHLPTWRRSPEQPDETHPLVLTTGRVRDQWHTMTRTGHIPQLLKSCPGPFLALHPSDALELGLADGDLTEVAVRGRGSVMLPARVTDDVPPGTAFAPFHWGGIRHAGGPINDLTNSAFDPISKQPGLKLTAARVRRAAGRQQSEDNHASAQVD
jgi:anaerobic selenocysteine-containing dehydrogenase